LTDWSSHKQRRVSHSSNGAEILACSSGDDRSLYLTGSYGILFPTSDIRNELNVDSRGLYDTITTLHEGNEYRLKQTVQRIRNSFESEELNVLRWIPGVENVADALTKRNIILYRKLNELANEGYLKVDLNTGYALDSRTWK